MQAAFVGLLEFDAYNYVRRLQVKIHELFGAKEALKLEPHFTIKYAFDIEDMNTVEDYFDEVVNEMVQTPLRMTGVNRFEKPVVFLDIAKNAALSALHLKILKDVRTRFNAEQTEFEGNDLQFHITLAYKDISEDKCQEILEHFRQEELEFTFILKRLGLYVLLNQSEQWFVYKEGILT